VTAEDGEQQQCHRRDQLESVCERDDEPAIEAIGDLSTGQKQHDERQELCESDEPQVFLFPGQLPHLVAEDHVDHLPGQRRGESAVRVAREIGMAQCLAAGRSDVADQSRRMEDAGCWEMRTLAGNVAPRWPLRRGMPEALR
jgi:hypothetical protein